MDIDLINKRVEDIIKNLAKWSNAIHEETQNIFMSREMSRTRIGAIIGTCKDISENAVRLAKLIEVIEPDEDSE